jgi:hypothetical protein
MFPYGHGRHGRGLVPVGLSLLPITPLRGCAWCVLTAERAASKGVLGPDRGRSRWFNPITAAAVCCASELSSTSELLTPPLMPINSLNSQSTPLVLVINIG